MCGIVGICGPQEANWVKAMDAEQMHRGPDGMGTFRDQDASVSLASRRLAIIDLKMGNQPMSSDDGRYVLVFNGEIFNAPELRKMMEEDGETFVTDHSDTEVMLRLLCKKGSDALPLLNGMFSFAFYDRIKQTLLCARDRFGIKPLYYLNQGGRFAFASELKSLLQLPFFSPEVCGQAVFDYMSLLFNPGTQSIVEGIHRLPPGHSLFYQVKKRDLCISCWWQPSFNPDFSTSASEWPRRLEETLEKAVKRWAISDVPVSCSLSGGLDSSAIVGLLARSGQTVRTFSLGFTGDGEEEWNELGKAREVADKWGTKHQEITLDPNTLLEDLVDMVWALDEPYGGGLPSWAVFKSMADHGKVAITGTGGDELFGNYGKWQGLEAAPLQRLLRLPVRQNQFTKHYINRPLYFSDREKRDRVFLNQGKEYEDTTSIMFRKFQTTTGPTIRDQVAALDITTQLAEEFLLMTDRFSMAHSMEARTPFLDNDFADLALSVPANLRTSRADLKGLLRSVAAPVLPEVVLSAPKRGFVIPLKLWLSSTLRALCEKLLAPERLRRQGLFRPNFLETYLWPHVAGRVDHSTRIWAAVMFQLWHLVYIEGNAKRPSFTLSDIGDL